MSNSIFQRTCAITAGVAIFCVVAFSAWTFLLWLGVATGCIAICATAPFGWLITYTLLMLASVVGVPVASYKITRWSLHRSGLLEAGTPNKVAGPNERERDQPH